MSKLDLKKENKELYNPSAKEASIIDVPEMNYLMIEGGGSQYIKDISGRNRSIIFSIF